MERQQRADRNREGQGRWGLQGPACVDRRNQGARDEGPGHGGFGDRQGLEDRSRLGLQGRLASGSSPKVGSAPAQCWNLDGQTSSAERSLRFRMRRVGATWPDGR